MAKDFQNWRNKAIRTVKKITRVKLPEHQRLQLKYAQAISHHTQPRAQPTVQRCKNSANQLFTVCWVAMSMIFFSHGIFILFYTIQPHTHTVSIHPNLITFASGKSIVNWLKIRCANTSDT